VSLLLHVYIRENCVREEVMMSISFPVSPLSTGWRAIAAPAGGRAAPRDRAVAATRRARAWRIVPQDYIFQQAGARRHTD